jgi:hypothetical protein
MSEFDFLGPLAHHQWTIACLVMIVVGYFLSLRAVRLSAQTFEGLRRGRVISSIVLIFLFGYFSLEYLRIFIREEDRFPQRLAEKRTLIRERVIKINYRER